MDLENSLKQLLSPEKVLVRPIDRYGYASDASFYRLIPQAVVQPASIEDIQALLAFSYEHRAPLTFRAAGTSLSGQAISDSILVDVARHWRAFEMLDDGARVRAQPGVRGGFLNDALNRKHGRRIGPDPASLQTAMLGGILANNAGGMSCGLCENSYNTLESITVVLADGSVYDSAAPDADRQLQSQSPHIYQGLLDLRQRILAQPELVERIQRKFSIKNTTGYSLNAFIDFERPLDILAHLFIGSEGTLGFIAEAVLRTFPVHPYPATALLLFAGVHQACQAIDLLRASGAQSAEMMDRAALRSVEHLKGVGEVLGELPQEAFALLVEYAADSPDELAAVVAQADELCNSLPLLRPAPFTRDPARRAMLWKIRKGLLPSAGAMRPPGTTALIEDLTFAAPVLADAITDLKQLLQAHGYPDAVLWGHGMDGNLHFVIAQSFSNPAEVARYDALMRAVADLTVERYDGSLKGEHGAGRNMAPFVEQEWGSAAYQIMGELKRLLDPENLLNPGVILNPDPQAHIRHAKTFPSIDPRLDPCIECGFCEPNCPSADLTLTPRRRIVVQREIARLSASGEDPATLASLAGDYPYEGLDTCAVDGLCALSCPVQINTGDYVKLRRAQAISPTAERNAVALSRSFAQLEDALRFGVGVAHAFSSVVGAAPLVSLTRLAERASRRRLPKWNTAVPHSLPRRLPPTDAAQAEVVYFPSCIARVMGATPGTNASLIETFHLLSARAGIRLYIPPDSPGACCGMPFSTKGYTQAFRQTLHATLEKFWRWSKEGELPLVIDSSSCAYTLKTCAEALDESDLRRWERMTILDPIEYLHDRLLPALPLHKLPRSVALHPNCSARKQELEGKLAGIARACAEGVTTPLALKCCGFAGDRGLLYPELTASATCDEAQEILSAAYDGYYSSNLTCEMGMRLATGKPYQSIAYLVEEASREG